MSDQPEPLHHEKPLDDKPFSAMTPGEKVSFICKAFVFFVSGGFIFPTLWID
jgi:hypothetical protein